MDNSGWIQLHRKIQDHWVFKDAEKLKAWLTIILEVNHSDEKVNIKNQLFSCKRGESLKSLDTWARLFNWDKSKTRRFLKLLENDSMIVLKSERKTTRLTVLNYDSYQGKRNADETQMKRKRNADETQMTLNNNDNNVNNDNNKGANYSLTLKQRKEKFTDRIKIAADELGEKDKELLNEFYRYWIEMNDNGKKMKFEKQKTFSTKRRLQTWIKNQSKFNPQSNKLPENMF